MSQTRKPALRSVSDSGSATSRAPSAPCCWSVRSPFPGARYGAVRGVPPGTDTAFAIAALAYNVLLGYTGLLSFGHAAFFRRVGVRGRARDAVLRDDRTAPVDPARRPRRGTIAVVIGFISVRHTEVYYALLMLALAHLIYVLTVKLYTITGGTDGVAITTPTIAG